MENQNDNKITGNGSTIKEFFISASFWKTLVIILIGGLAGYLYYYFIGCNSGTCAITSQPLNSIIAGGVFGYLLEGLFTSKPKRENGK